MCNGYREDVFPSRMVFIIILKRAYYFALPGISIFIFLLLTKQKDDIYPFNAV